MSEIYNKEACEIKHKMVNDKLTDHEDRLNIHEGKIDKLQIKEGVHSTQIDQLCGEIRGLVSTLNKFAILLVTSLGGFFIFVLQQKLFK